MSSSTLRILGYAALALSSFAVANGAEAGVMGGALSSFGHSSPVQTVQFGGSNCYYADGWNGRGWYQCGDEWNDGFGWIGPFNLNTFGGAGGPAPSRHGVVVSHPGAPNPVYRSLEPPRRLGAGGAPAFHTFGGVPGLHRFGAGGVPTSPNFRARRRDRLPRFCRRGIPRRPWRRQFSSLSRRRNSPHRRACVPRFCRRSAAAMGLAGRQGPHRRACLAGLCWRRRFSWLRRRWWLHGLGGATGVHIGAPASPSFAGVGTFHASGGFHGFGGAGGAHIGGFASPGFAGGGFHGVGGGGAFQGGGAAFGQGGIGHR